MKARMAYDIFLIFIIKIFYCSITNNGSNLDSNFKDITGKNMLSFATIEDLDDTRFLFNFLSKSQKAEFNFLSDNDVESGFPNCDEKTNYDRSNLGSRETDTTKMEQSENILSINISCSTSSSEEHSSSDEISTSTVSLEDDIYAYDNSEYYNFACRHHISEKQNFNNLNKDYDGKGEYSHGSQPLLNEPASTMNTQSISYPIFTPGDFETSSSYKIPSQIKQSNSRQNPNISENLSFKSFCPRIDAGDTAANDYLSPGEDKIRGDQEITETQEVFIPNSGEDVGIKSIQNDQILQRPDYTTDFPLSSNNHIACDSSENISIKCYKFLNIKPSEKDSLRMNDKIVLYLRLIERDNRISLRYLINRFVRIKSIGGIGEIPSHIFSEFITNLLRSFSSSTYKKNESLDFKILYERFQEFKKWVDLYYISKIKNAGNHGSQLYGYKKSLHLTFNSSEENIFDFYIAIFESENYSFLKEILPCFNLLHVIKTPCKFRSNVIYAIRYLQIIICKIEVFRYTYFQKSGVTEININDLDRNQEFNEMIAIVHYIFGKMVSNFKVSIDTLEVLEAFNFIYFIKANHNDFYVNSPFLKSMVTSSLSNNTNLLKIYNGSKQIVNLEFSNACRDGILCNTVREALRSQMGRQYHDIGKNSLEKK